MIISYKMSDWYCITQCPDPSISCRVNSGFCKGCPFFVRVDRDLQELICNNPNCMSIQESQDNIRDFLGMN